MAEETADLFERYLGERVLYVATMDADAVGHGRVVWQSTYDLFASDGVSRHHGIERSPQYRRRGAATASTDVAEATIRDFRSRDSPSAR